MRSRWILLSLIFGFLVPFGCSIFFDGIHPHHPFSHYGKILETKWLFNTFIVFTGFGLYLNGEILVRSFIREEIIKKRLLNLLIFSFIHLTLVGTITSDYFFSHIIIAAIFFISYCIFILYFGIKLDKKYKHLKYLSIIIGLLLVINGIFILSFTKLIFFEIIYLILILGYNLVYTRFKI